MIRLYNYLLIPLLCFAFTVVKAQDEDVDYKRIPNKKICNLLKAQDVQKVRDLQNIKPECYSSAEEESFYEHEKTYVIDAPVAKVWNEYKTIPPQNAWNCLLVNYGFCFSKSKNELIYPDKQVNSLQENQLHFLDLNLFGLFHIAVGHEVMEVNDAKRTMKFCYLSEGASRGSQWVRMEQLENGKTKVVHYTRYCSGSRFRDRSLYPFIHSLIISAFHHNVKKRVER